MIKFHRHQTAIIVIASCIILLPLAVVAEESPAKKDSVAAEPTTADEVLREMLKQRRDRPIIAPSDPQTIEAGPTGAPVRPGKLEMDPRVLGVAPGMPAPKLRREGEIIPLRRGRLVRSTQDGQMMFVFDADTPKIQEPPMMVMPCQTLENMERYIAARGDKVVFRLSGQVFTYRGANYILPLVMKLAENRGNLEQ